MDSAGVFLPLQEDVFPDTDDFGRVFRNNAVMSAMGIPQITAIMGMCVAGGAYLPVMCDHILMTEGSGLFLAGPALVQAAIGQKTSAEDLGRRENARADQRHGGFSRTGRRCLPATHSRAGRQNGRAQCADLQPCGVRATRSIPPKKSTASFRAIPRKQYDMREIIARIVDGSEFEEYRAEYGETVLCGYARIGGWAVGIVANQKKHVHDNSAAARTRSASNLAA